MFKKLSSNILRRNYNCKLQNYELSTAAEPILKQTDSFRTAENSPLNHSKDHIGKFYRVSADTKKCLFHHGGFPKSFETQVKTFGENCLMVREPAVDIISCMKAVDLQKPVVRFVLYGKQGTGKSLSLAHVLHYGHESGFLLVHVPWVGNWMRRCKEYSNSSTKEGYIDLPLDAAAWLVHFKNQNLNLLSQKTLTVSRDYQWSKREVTVKGTPLLELVDHGINRIKFASDCVVALAEEIKKLSIEGKCKTLVAIDGFNAFFYPNIRVYTEKKEPVTPDKVTLTDAFLNLTKYNWKNAIAVVTVDELAIAEEDQISHLPKYLLGKGGFQHLDPFVPVNVPEYSDKELSSCLEYFRERRWIPEHLNNDTELAILSVRNPYKLMKICAPL